MMKKILNMNFLKFQQLMINIKSFNICIFSFNVHLLKILNLKKKFKKKINVYKNKCCLIIKDKIKISINYHIEFKEQNY